MKELSGQLLGFGKDNLKRDRISSTHLSLSLCLLLMENKPARKSLENHETWRFSYITANRNASTNKNQGYQWARTAIESVHVWVHDSELALPGASAHGQCSCTLARQNVRQVLLHISL